MMKHRQRSIADHLSAATNARVLGDLPMGAGCSATIWHNDDDVVSYEQTAGHTFSFYLAGGNGTSRIDQNNRHGWQGAVCVMPQGHNSVWHITQPFAFLHLYMTDSEIRRQFARTFDKDARLLDVRELTLVHADRLTQPFQQLQQAVHSHDILLAEQATATLFCESMTSDILGELRTPTLSGGLTPRKLRMVKDYMTAHIGETVHLKDLAELTDLSDFHFQRNFAAQCGVSPHTWLTHLRIDRAKSLIRQKQRLVEVASACGFSSQSHFSRTFKHYTGVTPKVYSQSL